MRAVIAARFSAYTFQLIDSLAFDEVMKLYVSAQWLSDEEVNQTKRKQSRGARNPYTGRRR